MEKCAEILSPVGDLNTFYTAVKSGADAVYLGLPKFNARIKAENISLDNLSAVVKYAHLHKVKVYVTLNTLVTTHEMSEVIALVDACVEARVDAYIVQDLGIISVLRSMYPGIVLHGSTQMGVHNVHGARVAKKLGLKRVVLSRECTLDDIREIKKNVDIELEVFVQGAMCVAFSGNCYMSAIKCGASGNRGECKQLCRLPYTLSNGEKSISGYTLSMRDNCMMPMLKELLDLGVESFKIEGRLKRSGYVAVMTREYRQAVDQLSSGLPFDYTQSVTNMSKVFARGNYICGYNDGNDTIGVDINNHLGEMIGRVVKCNRFKDIYQIYIDTDRTIHVGDGIKYVCGVTEIESIVVGNVDKYGNNTILYGTKSIPSGTNVYLSIDSEYEKNVDDITKKYNVSLSIYARPNARMVVTAMSGDISISVEGDVCDKAKSADMDSVITTAIDRANKGVFDTNTTLDISGAFLPVSRLNAIMRNVFESIERAICDSYFKPKKKDAIPNMTKPHCDYTSIAIVNNWDKKLASKYDALIYAPDIYSVAAVEKFYNDYKKAFKSPLYLNMPMIAMHDDLPIVDSIVDYCKGKDIVLVAQNIYVLDYIRDGLAVMAGAGMNVANDYASSMLCVLGVQEVVSSIEKWCPTIENTYKVVSGRNVLMTFCHCPNKTIYHNNCDKCSHRGVLTLSAGKNVYPIRRIRIKNCYFELLDSIDSPTKYHNQIFDIRGLQ